MTSPEPTYRHRKVFDLAPLPQEGRDVLQIALNETDLPFEQIRQAANARVKVNAGDLKRLEFAMEGRDEISITEWRDDEAQQGIVRSDGGPKSVSWLPSRNLPAGGIELADHLFDDDQAARDEFIARAEETLARYTQTTDSA